MGEKVLSCALCGGELTRQSKDFWKCRNCGSEVWPDEERLREVEYERNAREQAARFRAQLLWSISKQFTTVLPAGPREPSGSGGGKSGRRRKRKPLKKFITAPWKI